jgi:deoxyribonuclease-4
MKRIGGHVSTSGGLINAVKNTLAIGGNAMQIFAGSPRMWKRALYPEKVTTEFVQAVKENDLNPVYIHALYLTNLASDNPELVDKSRTALITDMKNSAAIGSAGVVLHIGSHQGRGWEAVKAQVIEEIQTVLNETPANSYLLLENSAGQKGKIGSLPELGEILYTLNSPRLKVCLDTAHAFEAGYNFASQQGREIFISDIENHLPPEKLELLHLNDSKTPLGSGRDNHENIGDGYIGRDGIKELINNPIFKNLPLLLEVPGLDKKGPDKENIQRVRDLVTT